MSESHWEGSSGEYTLLWGGRRWTLSVDEMKPGLCLRSNDRCDRLLSLYGIAAAGRFDSDTFTPATLVGVERYRSRVQATFAPAGWGGLTVRAAWSPSCEGAGVDLEVQASASSVGQLRAIEVLLQSQWHSADETELLSSYVQPRDARSAALSYDGRQSPEDLCGLTTLPVLDSPSYHVFSPPGTTSDTRYLEMVQPNDVARRIQLENRYPTTAYLENLVTRYGLFGHDFEKGVVFRARLRACWLSSGDHAARADALYQQFLDEPPPLGP